MSEKITQSLGIDAGQALDALKQLDNAFKGFEARLQSTAQAIKGFNDSAKGVDKLGDAFKSNIPASTKEVEKLTVSLGLLSRVVFTQFIVRALSQLRNAFQSTAESAIDFQKRVALIRTIDDSGRSFDQLGNSVRNLSDQFNLPLLETASGLYQAISNQVGDFGESLKFTAEAAQFAKATNSSLANSVDLLSGVLKSYGLTVDDTDKVASTFFKTIDLGRIEANELANSFGRVGPIAAELGVSLEETGAVLAAISVKGSKTAETLTQFRAILTALQKPTEEMQKALRDLGFTSSETALRTLGLPGVLNALADSTGGSAEQLAKLFPNVRGLSGAASLLSDDLKSLSANISEMTEAGRDFNKEKFLQATATDAEKVTAEINKLRNAFTVDLGQAVLKSAADFSEFTGGADNVVSAVKVAGPALLGLGATFLVFRGQVMAASGGLTSFSKALGALSLVPLAAGLGTSIGQSIDAQLVEARFRDLKKLEAENTKSLETFKKQQAEARDFAMAADEAKAKSARLLIQSLNKSYLQDLDNSKTASDALVANSTAAIGKIVGARERLVNELAKAAADSEQIAKQSVLRIDGLRDKQSDRDFTAKISGFDDIQKSFALAQRAQEIARTAGEKLATAVDAKAVQQALGLFAKAEQTGEAAAEIAAEIAARTGNRAAEAQAAERVKSILDLQIQAETRLLALQDQRQGKLEKEREKQQKIVEAIRAQTKLALDNTGLFDKSGNRFNAADQAKREATRQAALKQVANLALSQSDLSATGALGLADFVSRFQSELSRDPIKLAFDTEAATAEIKRKLDTAFQSFRLNAPIDVGELEKVLGKTFSNPDQLVRGLEEAIGKAAELRAAIDNAVAGSVEGQQLQGELDKLFAEIEKRSAVRGSFGGDFSERLRRDFAALQTQLQALRTDSELTEAELNSLIDARNKFGQAALAGENPLVGRLGFAGDIQTLDAVIGKLKEMQALQSGADVSGLKGELEALQAVIGAIDPTARFDAAATAIGRGVPPAQQIAEAFANAATSAERAAAAISSGPPVGRFHGGEMNYFANGGRGMDTIPAMLSPNEFVVNAASSQKFFSQLQAINAGRAPVFRQDGGSVTNTTVGDIVINGASAPMATAREVMTAIRREQRRGSGRL